MDGLIILLIIIGLISRSKKKKQQNEKSRAKHLAKTLGEVISDAAKVEDAPFSKEDWAKLVGQQAKKQPAPAKKAAAPRPAPMREGHSPAVSVHEGRAQTALMNEGHSPALRATQGESAEEHRKHVERILTEEKRHKEALDAQQAAHRLNQQKLRDAVIMSEILAKPVSLRPRGYRS